MGPCLFPAQNPIIFSSVLLMWVSIVCLRAGIGWANRRESCSQMSWCPGTPNNTRRYWCAHRVLTLKWKKNVASSQLKKTAGSKIIPSTEDHCWERLNGIKEGKWKEVAPRNKKGLGIRIMLKKEKRKLEPKLLRLPFHWVAFYLRWLKFTYQRQKNSPLRWDGQAVSGLSWCKSAWFHWRQEANPHACCWVASSCWLTPSCSWVLLLP